MLRHIRTLSLSAISVLAVSSAAVSVPLTAQSPTLLQLQAGSALGDRFVVDSGGGFVAYGFAKDDGNTTACASQLPAAGAGTRFMWLPCRGAMRAGRVSMGEIVWDDVNIGEFSFAGGQDAGARGTAAFAYGDQVIASGIASAVVGSENTVTGAAGFASGTKNWCGGFACTAMGFMAKAEGLASVAIGYRVTANNDYAVALGYRASNNGKTGTFIVGDESTTDSVRNQANNEFRVRATGGIRLRTSVASNAAAGTSGNIGCDLNPGSGSWSCASSRQEKENFADVDGEKENFADVDGEDVLAKLSVMPVTTWNYIVEGQQVRHMGPFAQDFHAAFGLGTDSTSIGMIDINGVNVPGIKALEQRTTELRLAQVALEEKA